MCMFNVLLGVVYSWILVFLPSGVLSNIHVAHRQGWWQNMDASSPFMGYRVEAPLDSMAQKL